MILVNHNLTFSLFLFILRDNSRLHPNQLNIRLQSNGKYLPIPTQKTLLISGKAKIKNWENIQNLVLSSSDFQSTTTLYGKGTFEAACEKVDVNRTCPIIDDFTPKIAAAGVGTQSENEIPGVITILGANFDNLDEDEKYHPDEYRVAFTDVPSEGWMYPPQRDYLAWSDTEIRVRVPSLNENGSQGAYAGTGKVAVFKIDEQNCYDTTDVDLYVPFCARNSPISFSGSIQSIKTKMADMDTDGGYEILLEDSYLEIDSAGIVFKRALETWQCQVRVNFKAKLIDDLNDFNFFCPVFLDETLPMGVLSTTLASTNVTPNACLDDTFDHSFLPNFSIRFNKYITDSEGDTISINWHTDTIPLVDSLDILPQNVDLETVALHEIGHGLLLRHTLNDKNVMHKGQLPTRRSLTSDDFNGGDHTVRLSIANPNCQANMKAFDCSTNAIFELGNSKTNYTAFPNPVTDFLTIEYDRFMEGEYNVFEITGKNISNVGSMAGKKHNIDVGNLLKGIYFVSFKEKETGSLLTIKIIKQ